jgi:hypothetical protein
MTSSIETRWAWTTISSGSSVTKRSESSWDSAATGRQANAMSEMIQSLSMKFPRGKNDHPDYGTTPA